MRNARLSPFAAFSGESKAPSKFCLVLSGKSLIHGRDLLVASTPQHPEKDPLNPQQFLREARRLRSETLRRFILKIF